MKDKMMELPEFRDIRKMYVQARSGYGTTRLGQIGQSAAHAEFNAFVQAERDKAAQAVRLQCLREGWRQGAWHVFVKMGGTFSFTGPLPIDGNPYEDPES